MIHIKQWFGRLGNNIHQLANAHLLAERHKCGVGYPNNNHYYNPQLFKPSPPIVGVKASGMFFYRDSANQLDFEIKETDIRRVCVNDISKLLNIKEMDIPDDVIILHVRNGDIFIKDPHAGFVQPPMAYYTKIFDVEKVTDFSKVWVLCSNEQPFNPVVEKLREMGCVIRIEGINESINIMANAKTLIASRSSFAKYLFFLSKKAEKMYAPDYMIDLGIINGPVSDIEILRVNMPDYIKVGSWKASPEQLNLMLTYDESKITINVL